MHIRKTLALNLFLSLSALSGSCSPVPLPEETQLVLASNATTKASSKINPVWVVEMGVYYLKENGGAVNLTVPTVSIDNPSSLLPASTASENRTSSSTEANAFSDVKSEEDKEYAPDYPVFKIRPNGLFTSGYHVIGPDDSVYYRITTKPFRGWEMWGNNEDPSLLYSIDLHYWSNRERTVTFTRPNDTAMPILLYRPPKEHRHQYRLPRRFHDHLGGEYEWQRLLEGDYICISLPSRVIVARSHRPSWWSTWATFDVQLMPDAKEMEALIIATAFAMSVIGE